MTVEELEQLAVSGEVTLQYQLGMLFKNKEEAYYNEDKSLKYLQMAADHGNAEAQCELGVMYCSGEIVGKDYEQGRKWLQLSAENGSSYAYGNLGLMYLKGYGVPVNIETAFSYFKKAADRGDAHAMRQMAAMYQEGCGVEKNEKEASFWIKRAEIQETFHENYPAIQKFSEEGNQFLKQGKYQDAEEAFLKALALIPEPKAIFSAAAWEYAALGEVYVRQERFEEAQNVFFNAYHSSEGAFHPYIHYMLGKCLYETGKESESREFFHTAYELAGKDIFEEDQGKYLHMVL